MAKFVIVAAALIVMVGYIEASPVLGLLGDSGVQNQAQGVLGLANTGGLLGTITELTAQVLDLASTAIHRKTQEEIVVGIPTAAQVAASTIAQAKSNGATKAQAVEQAKVAVVVAIRPFVERSVMAGITAAADQFYGPDVPQGLPGYGRK